MSGQTYIPADDFSAYFFPQHNALVTTNDMKTITRPTTAVVKNEGSDEMSPWGPDNDFPQLVIKDVRLDPELPNLLSEKANLLYSGGVECGILDFDDQGNTILKPPTGAMAKEVAEWRMRSNLNRYILEAARDLYWFYNVFPELVLSQDRSKIIQLCVQPAEYCRWKKQNPSTGMIETCFINANFPEAKSTDPLTKKLPVLDPYYDPASSLILRKELNFIYPLSIPTPGSFYYQLADWNSIRESGWLAVSRAIPKFKQAVLEKQMVIKYHIEISDKFWGYKYPGFDTKPDDEKSTIKKTELDGLHKMLSGAANAGSNFVSPFFTDPATGKDYPMWKITVLDDKLKDGKYLEDGKDASLYKSAAMGLHPALIGTMPNNGMGGAGSNIREAYLLHILKVKSQQDIILEPLNNVVSPFNGWDGLHWRFKNSFMTTLDKGSETSKNIA